MREQCAAAGKVEQFEALKDFITGLPDDGSYAKASRSCCAPRASARVPRASLANELAVWNAINSPASTITNDVNS